jgi:H+/Cl- antiporter ClcA
MSFFFEYIYYRITKLFFKRDGRRGFTGIAAISLSQGLIIITFIGLFLKVFTTIDFQAQHSKELGYLGAIIEACLLWLNNKKYDGNYHKYRFYWKDEGKKKYVVKGWLIILFFLLIFVVSSLCGRRWAWEY